MTEFGLGVAERLAVRERSAAALEGDSPASPRDGEGQAASDPYLDLSLGQRHRMGHRCKHHLQRLRPRSARRSHREQHQHHSRRRTRHYSPRRTRRHYTRCRTRRRARRCIRRSQRCHDRCRTPRRCGCWHLRRHAVTKRRSDLDQNIWLDRVRRPRHSCGCLLELRVLQGRAGNITAWGESSATRQMVATRAGRGGRSHLMNSCSAPRLAPRAWEELLTWLCCTRSSKGEVVVPIVEDRSRERSLPGDARGRAALARPAGGADSV